MHRCIFLLYNIVHDLVIKVVLAMGQGERHLHTHEQLDGWHEPCSRQGAFVKVVEVRVEHG